MMQAGRALMRGTLIGFGALTAMALAPWSGAAAYTHKAIYGFCAKGPSNACTDGGLPKAGLIADAAGNLYGTTSGGGAASSGGTVFELSLNAAKTAWIETVLHRFCLLAGCADGATPAAGLLMDASGNLYGTTGKGGRGTADGTVFELTPNAARTVWSHKPLYRFCAQAGCADGQTPASALIMDSSGALYGTTLLGGAAGVGTVFRLTPNAGGAGWSHKVLHSFCTSAACGDGQSASAGLVMDGSGNLYGTTSSGGAHDGGVVYALSPNAARTAWKLKVLYSFCAQTSCADGQGPGGGLVMDGSGSLYGTTASGGASQHGTVFELAPNAARTAWTETVLHSLCTLAGCADGALPEAGLIRDASGDLYGTTYNGGTANNGGTVFELVPNAARTVWTAKRLYGFCPTDDCKDGLGPQAGLLMDTSGDLYGTTTYGGAHAGGTVFELKR